MAKLGNFVNIKTGKLDANASSVDGKYPFFTCATTPLRIDSYSYDCECALVAGNGDLNVKYYNGKFDAYQRTYIIESKDKAVLTVPYIYRFLEKYVETLRTLSIGGVIKYIKLGNLTEADIKIIDISEQRKIVYTLEKIDSLLNNLEQQLLCCDDLIKSRFVEMFGEPNKMDRWQCCKVKDIADVTVGLVIKPTRFYTDDANTGIKAFRSLNVREMRVNDSDWVYFSKEGNEQNKKSQLQKGDVLIVRSGYPGTSCVVTDEYVGCNAIDIIIARPNQEKVNPYYLCAFNNFPHGMNQIQHGTGGAAQKHFNVGAYNDMVIAVPPMKLQNDFVEFMGQTDKSKLAVQQSIETLKLLKEKLMQKYFCVNV